MWDSIVYRKLRFPSFAQTRRIPFRAVSSLPYWLDSTWENRGQFPEAETIFISPVCYLLLGKAANTLRIKVHVRLHNTFRFHFHLCRVSEAVREIQYLHCMLFNAQKRFRLSSSLLESCNEEIIRPVWRGLTIKFMVNMIWEPKFDF